MVLVVTILIMSLFLLGALATDDLSALREHLLAIPRKWLEDRRLSRLQNDRDARTLQLWAEGDANAKDDALKILSKEGVGNVMLRVIAKFVEAPEKFEHSVHKGERCRKAVLRTQGKAYVLYFAVGRVGAVVSSDFAPAVYLNMPGLLPHRVQLRQYAVHLVVVGTVAGSEQVLLDNAYSTSRALVKIVQFAHLRTLYPEAPAPAGADAPVDDLEDL